MHIIAKKDVLFNRNMRTNVESLILTLGLKPKKITATMNLYSLFFTICMMTWGSTCAAQLIFNNPSFEDEPSDATVPMGWFPCEPGTTPDIGPGPWGIDLEAEEGETYVGLITRSDGTYEAIGQRFPDVLEKELCYTFKLSAAACDTYSGFNGRVKFRVWGGTKKCKRSQLLYESETIDYTEWKEHEINFTAEKKLKYVIIEAYTDEGPIRGHILLDNITNITKCNKA